MELSQRRGKRSINGIRVLEDIKFKSRTKSTESISAPNEARLGDDAMRLEKTLILVVTMCISAAAFADSIFTNAKGQISKSGTGGLQLTGSLLTSVSGVPGFDDPLGTATGFVSMKTGALDTGSLSSMATFFDAGGMFMIHDTNTTLKVQGTLTNAVWTPSTGLPPNQFGWTLSGTLGAVTCSPSPCSTLGVTTGGTVQLSAISTNGNPFAAGGSNKISLLSGQSKFGNNNATTPEPGTLGLLGTGLVGIGMIAKRRISKNRSTTRRA